MAREKLAYGFDMKNGLPVIALHVFRAADDGQLEHYIDGIKRAVVPPEGWENYVQTWPDAGDVIDSLRGSKAVLEIKNAVASVESDVASALTVAPDATSARQSILDKIDALQKQLHTAIDAASPAPVTETNPAPVTETAPAEIPSP